MTDTRKLAAILAADVAEFSRLVGADEEGTLARMRDLRGDLFDPAIAVHNGRLVKRTGDGFLVDFRSAVDAVRCAVDIQRGMLERNAGLAMERRIDLRIGIHVGDVVEESDGDIMGDGVNIAARLESMAQPGAICLSEDAYRPVRNHVRSQLEIAVRDLGEGQLKNIAEPVRIYSLQVDDAAPARPAAAHPSRRPSAISNVAIRVPTHFMGREDSLAAIATALTRHEGRVAVTALHGLRGVGKSTLAAAYADRHRSDYRVTWWIRAESDATMRADVVSLGARLRWVAPDQEQAAALAAVMERLHLEGDGILLIYDNAIDATALKPYLPRGAARVLVTSNTPAWRGIAEPVEIKLWPKDVGADYLMMRTGRAAERAAAEALSEALGGLPLAHEQAAAYCERLGLALTDYHRRFEAAPTRLLDAARDAPAEYHDGLTVAKAFALAIEEAGKLHPAAEPLIVHAALLAPEPIPLFLLSAAREKFGEPLASALADDGLDEAVAALRTFALVRREEITLEGSAGESRIEAIQLHRLVREVALARRKRTVDEQTLAALAQSIESGLEDHRFANARAQVVPHAVSLLYFLQTDEYRDSSAGDLYEALAERVIVALFDLGPRNISPDHLASVLREYYEDGPLFGAISAFRRRNPEAWAAIERPLVRENNFVLRHAMSHALADACQHDQPLVADTVARFDRAEKALEDLPEFEFAGYALALIYAREPHLIERSFVERLSQYPIYPGQQLVGDLLLNLVFQTTRPDLLSWDRWLDIRRLATHDRLWKSRWDFIKLHASEIEAAEAFIARRGDPPSSGEARQCYANLVAIDERLDAAKRSVGSGTLRDLLARYFALGREPASVQKVKEELTAAPNRRDLFWLLLGHPIWYVAEETASILSSLAEEDAECGALISAFLGDANWRVQYGANEAAFSARAHCPKIFEDSVRRFFDHPNCRIRALCTENLMSVLLTSGGTRRERLMHKFEREIRHWLNDEDCAILEHAYRFFAALYRKGIDLEAEPFERLLREPVSRLVRDAPNWYMLERAEFLQHIEKRKEEVAARSGTARAGPGAHPRPAL